MNDHWQITKCDAFLRRLNTARQKVERIDEFIDIAEKALITNPGFGKKTGKNKIYALPMTQVGNNPKVVLFYLITTNEILFVDLLIGNVNGPQRIFL